MPLWVIGLLLALISVLVLEGGAWIAGRQQARMVRTGTPQPEKSDAQGYVIGAIFGLLAFLIGLTFSIALNRFDDRRIWVTEEATAISTCYLRVDLLDEPFRSNLRFLLRDYARVRVVPDNLSTAEMDRRYGESERLRAALWNETRQAVFPVRETELGSYVVEGMNNMLDVGSRRTVAGRSHIPRQILYIQFIYLIVSAGVLGYLYGAEGNRRRFASTLLIALFVLAFVLILDVDRPRSGSVKVSQSALQELVARMDSDAKRETAAKAPQH